ncbi:hypothetical protein IB238_11800 [Rhizobium sp. ARZ01]|uniref:hypothetical protein n=1 Tax=Rhizobium sp. ARZ01 TaxID=2769313 RepID=UPI001780061C|nr:hypothetical protein [Rhizobium sp. ARZ01]MBD9373302.1 hypothetical protein [Rhizobium sp. ARZ01]
MNFRRAILPVAAIVMSAVPAWTQDAAPEKGLQVELNGLVPSQKGCVFTFVVGNGLPQAVAKASFEFVLFNGAGTVERMVVLDFRELPQGKTKVRQFDLPGTKCDSVKRVLINDAPVCDGEGLAAGACMSGIVTRSGTNVGLEG